MKQAKIDADIKRWSVCFCYSNTYVQRKKVHDFPYVIDDKHYYVMFLTQVINQSYYVFCLTSKNRVMQLGYLSRFYLRILRICIQKHWWFNKSAYNKNKNRLIRCQFSFIFILIIRSNDRYIKYLRLGTELVFLFRLVSCLFSFQTKLTSIII